MKILELGSYIVPAYAGMLLAEQGHSVQKWIAATDPILSLWRGEDLWKWINAGKELNRCHARNVADLAPGTYDIVLDNFRPSTLAAWGIDPALQAERLNCVWVSMRADVGEISFDAIAQARGWLDVAPYVPFYAGDTIGGLWLAFKALAVKKPGHYTVMQAASLAKLIEGELTIDVERSRTHVPWDLGTYEVADGKARVEHKGSLHEEPIRDREWKLANLRHKDGRIII
jgi:hypothetical protein